MDAERTGAGEAEELCREAIGLTNVEMGDWYIGFEYLQFVSLFSKITIDSHSMVGISSSPGLGRGSSLPALLSAASYDDDAGSWSSRQ